MREGEAPRIGPAALGRHRHLINILPSGQLNGTLPQRRLISQLRLLAWLGLALWQELTPRLLAANLCEVWQRAAPCMLGS